MLFRSLYRTAQQTGQDQALPEAYASIGQSGFNGKAFASVSGSYNVFDPFGSALTEYDNRELLSKLLGGVNEKAFNPQYERLVKLHDVFLNSLKADWVTSDELKGVLAAQQASGSGARDYQTLTPFDQGYKGPSPSSWQPDLVSTKDSGAKGTGDINVNVELKAQDERSFRQNAATIDSMMYAAVERAKRRVNR